MAPHVNPPASDANGDGDHHDLSAAHRDTPLMQAHDSALIAFTRRKPSMP